MAGISIGRDSACFSRLRSAVRGTVLTNSDAGYDEARKIYNAMVDRRPAAIVRCAGCADVVQALRFARDESLLVAIRGGGHNVAGNALCDDGLVIDLSRLGAVHVDPIRRLARAEGGATWADYDRETQAFGLASTGGAVSTTGIAGLTLGGGFGWLMRKHGLACDNLQSVDVVTAEGNWLRASADENSDLFWGIRGGGGNFGVVTSFEYRLHPVGPVLGGLAFYPLSAARDVFDAWREVLTNGPAELGAYAMLMTLPDVGPVAGFLLCHHAPEEGGEAVIARLKSVGVPIVDDIRLRSYREMQCFLDEGFCAGYHNYWKSQFLKEVTDDAINAVVEAMRCSPSPLNAIAFERIGGAVERVPGSETAFPHRGAFAGAWILSRWTEPAHRDANISWARQVWAALQPSSLGVYVNMLNTDPSEQVEQAYGSPAYRKLADLKRRYDPDNFFRVNQNIEPSERR